MRLPNNKGLTTNNKHGLLQIFPGDRKISTELSSFDYFLWISSVSYYGHASGLQGLVCITKKTSADDALKVFIQIA